MTTTILGRCRAPRTLSSLGRMHSIHYNYTTRRCMLEMSAIECVFMICKFAKTFANSRKRLIGAIYEEAIGSSGRRAEKWLASWQKQLWTACEWLAWFVCHDR